MLVLSRRRGGEVVIDDDIRMRVADVKAQSVKLGISAPARVAIRREELMSDSPRAAEGCKRLSSRLKGLSRK